MADVMNIQKLVKAAAARELAKQAASVDSERNKEHEEDIKAIPANVDSQSAAGAVGVTEKDPAMNIGTKAEATTDEPVDGCKKEKNDDQAFKSASDLQKLASLIIDNIEAAVTKEAATAITVDAAEGTSGVNSEDDPGTQEKLKGIKTEGGETQTTTSATQTAPVKQEEAGSSDPEKDPADSAPKPSANAGVGKNVEKVAGELASEIYTMAQSFLVSPEEFTKQAGVEEELAASDVDGLDDSEADELAAALEASASDASQEGTEDADNVAQYLDAYQNVPGEEGMGAEGPMDDVPEAPVGEDGDISDLLKMLEEAGVTPEELASVGQQKEASTNDTDAWAGLSKEAKHEVVLNVLEGLSE